MRTFFSDFLLPKLLVATVWQQPMDDELCEWSTNNNSQTQMKNRDENKNLLRINVTVRVYVCVGYEQQLFPLSADDRQIGVTSLCSTAGEYIHTSYTSTYPINETEIYSSLLLFTYKIALNRMNNKIYRVFRK